MFNFISVYIDCCVNYLGIQSSDQEALKDDLEKSKEEVLFCLKSCVVWKE